MTRTTRTTSTTSRRSLLWGAAGALPAAAVLGRTTSASAADPYADLQPLPVTVVPKRGTQVVLLGTGGGPVPFPGRVGICTAVVVDGYTYLVDLGHGAFDQLGRTDLDPGRIPAAYLTHLHSDHLADAWALPWLRFGGANPLRRTLHLYGPGPAGALPPTRGDEPVRVVNPENPTPGTEDFLAGVIAASAYDLNIRMRDETWPDIATMVQAHDVLPPASAGSSPEHVAPDMEPFEVMRDERVTVTATLVAHAPVYPSYAFRFETADGSVTISGDTAPSDNLVRLARDTDMLVHEVIDVEALALDPTMTPERLAHLTEAHTDSRKVGALAQRAGAGRLVLSHLAPSAKALPDSGWKRQAQRGYDGDVHVGNDLDVLALA